MRRERGGEWRGAESGVTEEVGNRREGEGGVRARAREGGRGEKNKGWDGRGGEGERREKGGREEVGSGKEAKGRLDLERVQSRRKERGLLELSNRVGQHANVHSSLQLEQRLAPAHRAVTSLARLAQLRRLAQVGEGDRGGLEQRRTRGTEKGKRMIETVRAREGEGGKESGERGTE